jgi:hypothetical protein
VSIPVLEQKESRRLASMTTRNQEEQNQFERNISVSGIKAKSSFKCRSCGLAVTIKPTVIYCPSCKKRMSAEGNHFFDHVKIVGLHKSTRAFELHYVFNLSVGGIIINGCTYKPSTSAVLMPTRRSDDRSGKQRIVKMFPATAKKIRLMLDEEIARLGFDKTSVAGAA